MPEIPSLSTFNLMPHVVALTIAYLLALPIGWNREKEERSTGIRTFPLVAVASSGFIQATENRFGAELEAMARIMEGLITGMGFHRRRRDPAAQGQRQGNGDGSEPVDDRRDRGGRRPGQL